MKDNSSSNLENIIKKSVASLGLVSTLLLSGCEGMNNGSLALNDKQLFGLAVGMASINAPTIEAAQAGSLISGAYTTAGNAEASRSVVNVYNNPPMQTRQIESRTPQVNVPKPYNLPEDMIYNAKLKNQAITLWIDMNKNSLVEIDKDQFMGNVGKFNDYDTGCVFKRVKKGEKKWTVIRDLDTNRILIASNNLQCNPSRDEEIISFLVPMEIIKREYEDTGVKRLSLEYADCNPAIKVPNAGFKMTVYGTNEVAKVYVNPNDSKDLKFELKDGKIEKITDEIWQERYSHNKNVSDMDLVPEFDVHEQQEFLLKIK